MKFQSLIMWESENKIWKRKKVLLCTHSNSQNLGDLFFFGAIFKLIKYFYMFEISPPKKKWKWKEYIHPSIHPFMDDDEHHCRGYGLMLKRLRKKQNTQTKE